MDYAEIIAKIIKTNGSWSMTYSFTDEDKIMSPNTYFYTEFKGQEFLDEYFANRELIIELSKEALEPLFVISDTQI